MAPPPPPPGWHHVNPSVGVTDPHALNNLVFFILFGVLGAAFVLGAVWFFFWARNGGFHFASNDWDDYKTTVLRRRGPNGTLLSTATAPTDLGGGSVYYKDFDDDKRAPPPDDDATTALSGVTAGASDVAAREHRRARQAQRHGTRHVGADGIAVDAAAGVAAQDQLRSYRHERPARVGGLNRAADGSSWAASARSAASASSPPPPPGIRRVQPSARRPRRDFSFKPGDAAAERMLAPVPTASSSASSRRADEDTGTKSYHHPMPELSAIASTYSAASSPVRPGGYRRGRGDDEEL